MKRALSIKYWLLIANAFLLLVPLFGFQFLRLWDRHLVRITEERLIAESALVAEVWLQELRRERGVEPDGDTPSPGPVEPVLVGRYEVLPAVQFGGRRIVPDDSPEWRSAERVATLLHGVRSRGATEMAVLDEDGCAVATVYGPVGVCFDDLPEVREALQGHYTARARERAALQSLSPSDIGRTGAVRVSTALPVYFGDRLIGVVHATQRASGPLEAVLDHRWTVIVAVAICVFLMLAVTWFLTRAISRPVRAVTSAAQAVARGEPPQPIPTPRLAPSELGVLGGSVNRMTELLTDRADYIANFAATVSHELKSPITSIRGAVELLEEQGPDMSETQRQRFYANIDAAIRRMDRLVVRLLELARIQSAPEHAESLDVRAFFLEIGHAYAPRLRLDLDAAPERIVMNPDHLGAAVRNLIENAMRHSGDRPVEVRAEAHGDRLRIRVTDHGAGISEGNRARIFERFFTTERDRGGTGLGLAIVQAVAEVRGGSVCFTTGPDGSTFELTV